MGSSGLLAQILPQPMLQAHQLCECEVVLITMEARMMAMRISSSSSTIACVTALVVLFTDAWSAADVVKIAATGLLLFLAGNLVVFGTMRLLSSKKSGGGYGGRDGRHHHHHHHHHHGGER